MFSLSAVESALHKVSRCTHSCLCNGAHLNPPSIKGFASSALCDTSSSSYCSSTPPSLRHLPQVIRPSLLSPSTLEQCSRLLAAHPTSDGAKRSLHHSSLSCTRVSVPLLKASEPKIDRSLVPELLEKDLEEMYIKGWGPGGQSVNKTTNAVFLKHKPTGLFVKVHKHRMRHKNALEARVLLQEKLDDLVNGPRSVSAQRASLLKKKSAKNASKAKKMRDLKAQWKESQAAGDGGLRDLIKAAGDGDLRDEIKDAGDDGLRDERDGTDNKEGLLDEGADKEEEKFENKVV